MTALKQAVESSRRRQSAHSSRPVKTAPTDVGGYRVALEPEEAQAVEQTNRRLGAGTRANAKAFPQSVCPATFWRYQIFHLANERAPSPEG